MSLLGGASALANQNSIPRQKHCCDFLARTRSKGRSLPLTLSGLEVAATASAVTALREGLTTAHKTPGGKAYRTTRIVGWKIHAITPKGDSGSATRFKNSIAPAGFTPRQGVFVSPDVSSFEIPAIARVKSLPSGGKLGRRNLRLRSPRDRQFHSAPGTSGEGNAGPTHDVLLPANAET